MSNFYKRGRYWWTWFRGERRSTRCEDQQAARAVVRGWERAGADPVHRAADQATLADAIRTYLAGCRTAGLAAGTLESYGVKVAHLARLLPARLADVTAATVDVFCSTRLEEGASRHTIHKELTCLRGTLKLAKRHKLYRADLGEVMPIAWSTGYKPRELSLSPEGAWALLCELRTDRAGHAAWLIATGSEWSPSLKAVRADVSGSMVHVRGTKRETRDRTVPLPSPFLRLLEAALSVAGEDVLFARWTNVRRELHEACDRAGLPRVSPNDLRRTFGQWLRQAGVEPHAIGAAMGHADSRMVERVYGKLTAEKLAPLLAAPYENRTPDDDDPKKAERTAESSRIENPRVGGSIPSLGTANTEETSSEAGSTEPTETPGRALVPYTDRTAVSCAPVAVVGLDEGEDLEPWHAFPAWLADVQNRACSAGQS